MRICLVSQEYPPETAHGGIGSQTYIKAHGMAARGHEVYVLSHSIDGKKHVNDDGRVRVIRIPGSDSDLPVTCEPVRWITYSVAVAAALSDLASSTPLDLVDFPEWGGEGYVHLLNRAEWNFIPTVVHLHGPTVMFAHAIGWPTIDSEYYRVGVEMEKTCCRLADVVFSSSQCSADWCAEHYGVRRDSIPILHTGVDTSLYRRLEVPEASEPTIVFVGKIAENKGVDLLLEACCRLAQDFPTLRLKVIGRGSASLSEALRKQAFESGFPQLLELVGFVDRQDLPEHLSRAHVFAAPSVYEGGPGFVYLEAMACGLPVIACEGSGAAEVVSHGNNGFLVPPHDVDSLTRVLRHCLENPEARRKLGRNARKYIEAECDMEKCLDRLEKLYLGVIVLNQPAKPQP